MPWANSLNCSLVGVMAMLPFLLFVLAFVGVLLTLVPPSARSAAPPVLELSAAATRMFMTRTEPATESPLSRRSWSHVSQLAATSSAVETVSRRTGDIARQFRREQLLDLHPQDEVMQP